MVVGSCKSTIRNMSDDAQFWLSLSQRAIAQRVKTENTIVVATYIVFAFLLIDKLCLNHL